MQQLQFMHPQIVKPSSSPTNIEQQQPSSKFGQGLSLSLSSSQQEFRMDNGGGIYLFDPGLGPTVNFNQVSMGITDQVVHIGLPTSANSSSIRMMNILRNSFYLKPAQELLEEFCCVGRGHMFKNSKVKIGNINNNNNGSPNSNISNVNGGGGGIYKERPPLSAAERAEYQRRKTKLLSMLDEVYVSLYISKKYFPFSFFNTIREEKTETSAN